MSSSILIFGYDEQLLRLRCLVLEKLGYEARVALSLKEAQQILDAQAVEMLILCNTLSMPDYQSVMATAREVGPQVKILAMESDRLKDYSDGEVTVLPNSLDRDAFFKAIQKISGRDGVGKVLKQV